MHSNQSLFQVNLQGLDLNEKQTKDLEQRLSKTTVEFLQSFENGKAYLDNAVAYTPNPDDPYPGPIPWPNPRPWPWPVPFPGFYPINRDFITRTFREIKF